MSDEKLHKIRHSLAHVMAAAVREIYPNVKLGIGPVIEDGFYYDFLFPAPETGGAAPKLSPEIFPEIEKRMRQLIEQKLPVEQIFVPMEQAIQEAKTQGQKFKLELLGEIKSGERPSSAKATAGEVSDQVDSVSFYKIGNFSDLCKGPHVKNTKELPLDSWKLDRLAGAYWKGDEKNPQLQRVYAFAFNKKKELEKHITLLEEAKQRDHKKLGPELDLFFIDEQVGKGLPMWTPKGTAVKLELENFTRELERKYGYEHVSTPYLGGEKLYHTSGHLEHYSQNMYAPIDMDGDKFYLRPMACPHHIRMYQRRAWSYRELPIRYAEIADYNRYEKSGELMGMIRVRKFQLTDAHLFVAPEGLKSEFEQVCKMIIEGIAGLGLSGIVSYRFSKRDPQNKEKYFQDDNLWNRAETVMKEALDELKIPYSEAMDEAAFYGPKLDIQARNANGKEDTLFTAQIDFLLPEKFNLEYIDAEGKKQRPVMIHRSTIGCLERTFAFMIEHYAGAFPLWLAPVQAMVISISDKSNEYAEKVAAQLKAAGLRAELDERNESIGKKIREAEMQKIPYILVVGEKEQSAGTAAVRKRGKGDIGGIKIDKLVKRLAKDAAERK
ncbi:MAG TPA: threonine--tRNA ligase [Candidatus Paceibacterota bacterium]|nr:threonine--tRNA ligase [Candidatus Paceibacterota bacterium]